MREFSIAAIPADGIGPEVIDAGVTVLDALQKRLGDVRFNVTHFDWGSDYYRKHGVMMPADGLDKLKKFDAIYFGAVGAPDIPDRCDLVGPAPADLPGLRPVRQCAPHPDSAGHHLAAAQCRARPIWTG